MRRTNMSKDFYSLVRKAFDTAYPGNVNYEFLDEVAVKSRTFPWITLKTAVDEANKGLKTVKERTGRIKVVVYDLNLETSMDINDNLRTIVENLSKIHLDSVKDDNFKIKLSNNKPYVAQLDFETRVYVDGITE